MKVLSARRGRPLSGMRDKIIQAAADLFKESGIASSGIDQVMNKCLRTAGTFYNHFSSKEELVREALRASFCESRVLLEKVLQGKKGADRLRGWAELYLSDKHILSASSGCAMPALVSELARSKTTLGSVFAKELSTLLSTVLAGNNNERTASSVESLYPLAALLVGTVSLARCLPKQDAALLLKNVREQLPHLIDGMTK